jgi:hypothetical protein
MRFLTVAKLGRRRAVPPFAFLFSMKSGCARRHADRRYHPSPAMGGKSGFCKMPRTREKPHCHRKPENPA